MPDLLFIDDDPDVFEALQIAFKWVDHVQIAHIDLEEAIHVFSPTAIITPGNSFGIMDGGFDAAVAQVLPGIDQVIRSQIKFLYNGYLPVGSALIAGHSQRCVCYAPTMRVPCELRSPDMRINIFDAMMASLRMLRGWDQERVVCPGFGTGSGNVPPGVAAGLMKAAWDEFYEPEPRETWEDFQHLHSSLVGIAMPLQQTVGSVEMTVSGDE